MGGARRAGPGDPGVRGGAPLGRRGAALRRQGAEEGGGRLFRPPADPPARSRDRARSRGHRDPHRPPLRTAGDDALRHPCDGAGVVRALQHEGRGRLARDRAREGEEDARLMSELLDLYQEVILDHNRAPHNYRRLPNANRTALGHNPLCGDQLTLYMDVEDGLIKDVSFLGSGCAISKASASIMTDALKGKTTEDAEALFSRFHE